MKISNYRIEVASNSNNNSENLNDYQSKFTLVVKCKDEVLGFATFNPLTKVNANNKALLLEQLICTNEKAEQYLVKESLMLAWEIGYSALFTHLQNDIFNRLEFESINTCSYELNIQNPEALGISLSWNGLELFCKSKTIV